MKFKATVTAIIGAALIGVFLTEPRAQQPPKAAHSVWDGVYSEDQRKRGDELYSENCASCHGNELTGNDEAPPLAGAAFLANWDGLTVGDVFERVRVSMPPSRIGRLSRQQISDIVSYVLSVNSFPAGKTELDKETEKLNQIKIEATNPKAGSGL